jgi:hypothetical protein
MWHPSSYSCYKPDDNIDDVLSLNNCKFGDFVDHIYPMELEIKDTIDTDRSVSSLDLHLEIDNEGRLRSNLTTKEMMSIFPLWTFLLYVATFQWHLHMEYISLIWSDIPELVIPIMISVRNIPICIYGILYFKLHGIDVINKITKLTIIQWKDIIYIAEREIKEYG